jgi:ABC-type multidrug transport system fused ATPase/permease subunit
LIARGALALERVSFGYETARPVLREISFALEPGRSAAVVGPSGAGKSTLLQLLPRFYDPCEGAVKLDGVDLRQLELHGLRSQIAFLMQEPILLPCTVAENIAYARPDATMAEIEEAARAAHADTFIARLPKGYDTPVGESATRLSAGEKQRLSLARAVLKDAPILLLDEPTASLDAESEALVWASLARLVRGRTVLLATHKLDAVRGLDQVLVLDQGRLIEEGSPAQLLSNSRSYLARLSR